MGKLKIISKLKEENEALGNSLQKLDQQAKLILKNDMDIKLYQQEIEGPNNNLQLLRKFISSTAHLLDKEYLFGKINSDFIQEFGFEKSLILTFDSLEKTWAIGFKSEETDFIKIFLSGKKQLLKEKKILMPDSEACKTISARLKTKTLIAPIKNKNRLCGFFLVAGIIESESIKDYFLESFFILCLYLGKCLDSIDLFEQVYRTKEDLENKIRNRTRELALSLQRLEAISKAKSDFISSVSHELRTPLTSVKGFSSLLAGERFGKLPNEAKIRLNKVVENVDKLMDIVNTLLDISRIESGKMEINIIPHDTVTLIKNVAAFFEPQSQSKNIEIKLNTPESLSVYMDKSLIERVLINILNNALKFTPPGGKIKITCQSKEEKAIISIADNGYGIKDEDQEKIFQEFYRVKDMETKAIKGSGLGLSLVKRIIDSHKEKIWVHSEINKGTTFSFTLQKVKNG